MKKVFSLILALVMCLSLCACGANKEKVKEEIQNELKGIWEYSWYASAAGFECSVFYQFGDSGSMTETNVRNGKETVNHGYYIVTDDVIEIYYAGESEVKAELTYTYEDGELSLVNYGDGTISNSYTKIK